MSVPARRFLAVVLASVGLLDVCSARDGDTGDADPSAAPQGSEPVFDEQRVESEAVGLDPSQLEPYELASGGALTVATVDGAFVVQWRDPEGEGWTAPEPLGGDQTGLVPAGLQVEAAGDTVLLTPFWETATDDDDPRPPSAIVCRDLACDTAVDDPSGEAWLSADGEVAVVEREGLEQRTDPDDTTYDLAVWRADDGDWSPMVVDAPPFTDLTARPALVLLSDGALATVRSDDGRGGCRFDLLVSDPLAGTEAAQDPPRLRTVATRTASVPAGCAAVGGRPGTLDDLRDRRIQPAERTPLALFVSTYGGTLEFVRARGRWTVTGPSA